MDSNLLSLVQGASLSIYRYLHLALIYKINSRKLANIYQSVYICKMRNGNRYSKSEKTKQYIIEKVAPVFNRKGYAGTSLADLTEATGLTKGSIYGNFENKDAVAIEAFKHNVSIITHSFISKVSECNASSYEKLLLFTKNYRSIYKDIMAIGGCPILNTASEADDTHPKLKSLAKNAVLKLENTIISLINEGIEQKQIKVDTDANKIANVMFSLVEGGFLLSQLQNDKYFFDNSLEQIENIIQNIKV